MRRLLPGLRANAADRQYGISRRVLNLERAPIKVPPTQIRETVKKAPPASTPAISSGLFLLAYEGETPDSRIYGRGSWVAKALLAESPFYASPGGIAGYQQTVMAFFHDNVYVSTDRNTSFTTQPEPITDQFVRTCGVNRSGVIWAISETGGDPFYSLWKSADLGATWTEVQADFAYPTGIAFGAPGQAAAWQQSDFAGGAFSGQIRLSEDDFATFDQVDTDDTVASADQTVFPFGVHYLSSGRIALVYVFVDQSGSPTTSEIRAVYLDGGSWTTPVVVSSLESTVGETWRSASKGTEIAVLLWGEDDFLVHTSPDAVTWTALAAVPAGLVPLSLAYETNGVLYLLAAEAIDGTTPHLYAYVSGAWVEDTTIPATAYLAFAVSA